MRREITRTEPMRAALVVAVVSFFLAVAITLTIAILNFLGLNIQAGGFASAAGQWSLLLIPVVGTVSNFFSTLVFCLVYNLVAPVTGGIVYNTAEMGGAGSADITHHDD